MKTNIVLGNIKIELERIKNKVSVDIFCDHSIDEESEDYMTLVGVVCGYLFKEGFINNSEQLSLLFDVKNPA